MNFYNIWVALRRAMDHTSGFTINFDEDDNAMSHGKEGQWIKWMPTISRSPIAINCVLH